MGRNQASYRQARRRVQQKYGMKKPPTFAPQPKGEIIFQNPSAVPVVHGPGKTSWKMQNVEWIRKRGQIAKGGFGIIFVGKIKLKGEPKPRTVIIKNIFGREPSDFSKQHYKLVIARLNQSKARHPKMFFFGIRQRMVHYF